MPPGASILKARQVLDLAHGDVVALDNGAGSEEFVQQFDELGLRAIHALVEGLDDWKSPVPSATTWD